MYKFKVYSKFCLDGKPTICDKSDGCDVSNVRSIKIITGTCGQIIDSGTGKFFTILEDTPNTEETLKGHLSSCPTHAVTLECPSEKFVKEIKGDITSNLTSGIELSCIKPESVSTSDAETVSSQPQSSIEDSLKIKSAVFDKITIFTDISKDAVIDINSDNPNITLKSDVILCSPLTALSGMSLSIETESKYYNKHLIKISYPLQPKNVYITFFSDRFKN